LFLLPRCRHSRNVQNFRKAGVREIRRKEKKERKKRKEKKERKKGKKKGKKQTDKQTNETNKQNKQTNKEKEQKKEASAERKKGGKCRKKKRAQVPKRKEYALVAEVELHRNRDRKQKVMRIVVTHAGHTFTTTEMTFAGEKHERDVSLFKSIGPDALNRISLDNAERVFAMLWCYYNFPVLRTNVFFADFGA
jgi:hypothetical protein